MNWDVFRKHMELIRDYRFEIEDLEKDKEDIFYIFYGVHGISFDRIPSSHSAEMEMLKREKFNEKIERINLEIKGYEEKIEEWESDLRRLPEDIQRMVERKFFDGLTYYQLGKEFSYSPPGIRKHIQKEVEKL